MEPDKSQTKTNDNDGKMKPIIHLDWKNLELRWWSEDDVECGDYDVADTYDVKKKEEEMENNWANDPPHPGSWSQTASGQHAGKAEGSGRGRGQFVSISCIN